MLEIVERILAALIILALLTLLIILAFPVPARQTPGPAPSTARNEDRPATKSEPPKKDVAARDKTPEPAKDTPKTDVGGASNGQTEADTRAEDARRRAEDDAKRRAEDDARRRADRADEDARRRENADHDRRRPGRSIQPAEARDCADPDCRRPIRRTGTRGCPNGSDGCGCGDERRGRVTRRSTLPYWAEPRRRYAVRDEDPDWFDERADDPGPPPGACPD